MFQTGYVWVPGSVDMHRKIVSVFLKHDRENPFLQQRQKPSWLLSCMEKGSVLGNSRVRMLLLCLGISRLRNGNSCCSKTHRAKMPTLPSSQESALLVLGTQVPWRATAPAVLGTVYRHPRPSLPMWIWQALINLLVDTERIILQRQR